MFEEQPQPSRWRIFWPQVSDLDGARETIRLGSGACFALAALTAIVATFGSKAGFVDAAVWGVIGWGIRRKSRAAAVIGVTLLSLSIMSSISLSGVPIVGVVPIICFVCLLSSVRGTFAYRKLARSERGAAVVEHANV